MARPNISLWGATYPTVPAVDLPDDNNGTARFYDRNGPLDFIGAEIEYMQQIYDTTTLLKNTAFNGWVPSTTAKTIISSATLSSPKPVLDMVNFEYALRWKFYCEPIYDGTETNTARVVKCIMNLWQLVFRRANSFANIAIRNTAGNACSTLTSSALLDYWNNNSSHTYTWSASYGFYASATAATFSNGTSNTPTLTIKTPSVSARCSTTYLSTSNCGKIDQDKTKIRIVGELYRYKPTGILFNIYDECCEIYNELSE